MSEIALPYRPRSEEDPRAASVVQSNLDYLTGLFTKGNNNGDTLQWDVIAQKFVATTLPAPPSLPARLGPTAVYPIPGNDWNNALDNGYYMHADAANAPGGGWWLGEVFQHNTAWVTQRVWQFTSGAGSVTYERRKLNGGWSGWVPVFQQVVLPCQCSLGYQGGEIGHDGGGGIVIYGYVSLDNAGQWDGTYIRCRRAGYYHIIGGAHSVYTVSNYLRVNGGIIAQNDKGGPVHAVKYLNYDDGVSLSQYGWDGGNYRGYISANLTIMELNRSAF
jgi:hypothetical protein